MQCRAIRCTGPLCLSSAVVLILGGCRSAAPFHPLATDHIAIEAKIRQLDLDWNKAANSASVDGWMSFYAADAVVLPPDEKTADDPASIRTDIASILGLKGLMIGWTPTRIIVADAGDMAYLYGMYTLHGVDHAGAQVDEVGKLTEVWRKQANGDWKCTLDMWSPDEAPAASPRT
jgi:ketosteroid isomerase-like protein